MVLTAKNRILICHTEYLPSINKIDIHFGANLFIQYVEGVNL